MTYSINQHNSQHSRTHEKCWWEFSPTVLGLPSHFQTWRKWQIDAIACYIYEDNSGRALIQVQPTGSGKSLCYMAAAILSGEPTVILTSTKALQDQLMHDFAETKGVRVADLRGQNSYPCRREKSLSCENGSCHAGVECSLQNGGCLYHDAVRAAKRADILITNYAYWLAIAQHGNSELHDRFRRVILDEAHDAPKWVSNACQIILTSKDFHSLASGTAGHPLTEDPQQWIDWAKDRLIEVSTEIAHLKSLSSPRNPALIKELIWLQNLGRKLYSITRIGRTKANLVVELKTNCAVLDALDISEYGQSWLIQPAKKLCLTSATINAKTAAILGLSQADIVEYPSTFPVNSRLVYYVPTVRVDRRMNQTDANLWLQRIIQIITKNIRRKGIIHSVSYERGNLILAALQDMEETRESLALWTHNHRNLAITVQNFKASQYPGVFVSPSIITGYDFPYEQCRYQIVAKLGFPDSRVKIVRERASQDPEHIPYQVMQSIVQATGRGVRAVDDWCTAYIIDDHWKWFHHKYAKFAPEWWKQALRISYVIPAGERR